MKQFLLVAFMTIVGFAAGFGGRVWQERHAPLPPPPGSFLGELGLVRGQPRGPIDRAQLIATIDKMGPQIEAYNERMKAIDTEFETNLQGLLTVDQKAFAADQKKKREAQKGTRPPGDSDKPLSDGEISHLTQRPFHLMVSAVLIPMRLEELNKEYKLDDTQEAKVIALLKTRRDEFLALIDTTPPPTLSLSRLAPEVARLATPAEH